MVLKISVTGVPGRATMPRELTLKGRMASVGRNHDTDVVLEDPERVVSGRHALIEIRGDQVWITDISRNGTFLNQSLEPLPPHQPVSVSAADRVRIGPFELRVSLIEESVPVGIPGPWQETPGQVLPDIFASGQNADILDLLGGVAGSSNRESALTDSTPRLRDDPFADAAALDSRLAGVARAAEPQADPHRTPVEHVFFEPPTPQAIPEGYDILHDIWNEPDEGASTPKPPLTPTLRVPATDPTHGPDSPRVLPETGTTPFHAATPSTPPLEGVPGPRATATPAPPPPPIPTASIPSRQLDNGSESAVVTAFLAGLGIGDPVAVENPQKLMHEAGTLLRELVAGLVRSLMVRAQFKTELRLGVTTIRPLENNPFKFAVDPGDVLDRLLLRPSPGFMPALPAAREAFDDICAHEMAMTAGLQAALRALLARFEPAELERRLNQRSGLGQWLPLGRKSHYWDLFTAAYAEVAADAADDFMRLFGETFAMAYREQIQRIAGARDRAPVTGRDTT